MGGLDILYPLRWVYRKLRGLYYRWQTLKVYFPKWKYVTFPLGKKVYVIGSPTHSNLGDSAIVKAHMLFLERCGWKKQRIKEIPYSEYENEGPFYDRWIPRNGLIAQLGGGHLGNQWINEELLHRRQVTAFPENPTVIFPQTIHYTQDAAGLEEQQRSIDVYNGRKKLTMVARERRSYDIMRSLYPDTQVLLTPDIVLSATMEAFGAAPQVRSGVLLCMRHDAERSLDDRVQEQLQQYLQELGLSWRFTDTHAPGDVTLEGRFEDVRRKMEELASAKLVITDRLHGMVFCALTGTPCVAFSNRNHKVRGTYEWISYLPYIRYAETFEQARAAVPELIQMENCRFDGEPLEPYYEQLAEVVRKYA